jgi:hypothetical protein
VRAGVEPVNVTRRVAAGCAAPSGPVAGAMRSSSIRRRWDRASRRERRDVTSPRFVSRRRTLASRSTHISAGTAGVRGPVFGRTEL